MPTKEEIIKYYASEDFKPVLPRQVGFRHFRFKYDKHKWRKAPFKISDEGDLQRWIVKLGGQDIYYGTSCWMNPHKISTKGASGTYHVADNLLLTNDLVFDIDCKGHVSLASLQEARKSTNNIYQLMKKHKDLYEFEYFAFTGYKGFRLSYKDLNKDMPKDPRKRIHFTEKNRNLFIKALLMEAENAKGPLIYKTKTFFDQKITTNPMCVVRVLGTVHSTTGYISTKLPVDLMRKPIKKLLDHVPSIGKKRPGIPRLALGNDTRRRRKVSSSSALQSASDVSGLASLPTITDRQYYITNRVLGVKRCFIPILLYQKNQNYLPEVKKLQEKYHLGNVFIYEDEKNIVVIALKTMQRRRLQKLLNESSSCAKHYFRKYKRVCAPFFMNNICMIRGNYSGSLSKGHSLFVEPNNTYHKNMAGWEKIEMVRASGRN
jgi:hypothetical protein